MTALHSILVVLGLALGIVAAAVKLFDFVVGDLKTDDELRARLEGAFDRVDRDGVDVTFDVLLARALRSRFALASTVVTITWGAVAIALVGAWMQGSVLLPPGVAAATAVGGLCSAALTVLALAVVKRAFDAPHRKRWRPAVALALLAAAAVLLPIVLVAVESAIRDEVAFADVVVASARAHADVGALVGLVTSTLTHWWLLGVVWAPCLVSASGLTLLVGSQLLRSSRKQSNPIAVSVLLRLVAGDGRMLGWLAWLVGGLAAIATGAAGVVPSGG